MSFEFAGPRRILFGAGCVREAGGIARGHGRRALVVTGKNTGRAERILQFLASASVEARVFPVGGEPSTDVVRAGVGAARSFAAEVVIGFGGGSALDAAKAVGILATNSGEPMDYLEILGAGKSPSEPSLPVIAIPTTAGTGSEATRNSVLSVPGKAIKVSLRSPLMFPEVALVDPELTFDLPSDLTANTGLDALTQLIEPFTCNRANPVVDGFCRQGIPRAARSLRSACADGHNAAAREDMALASLLGGLSLANAGLGVVHGFAAPIGGGFPAPHGAVCAALLPHAVRVNTEALRSRSPDHSALSRYEEVARMLTGNPSATAHDAVAWLDELTSDLKIPPLSAYGITTAHIADLVKKAKASSSIRANPAALTDEELAGLLESAL